MTKRIEQLADEIVRLQGELDREIEARRKVLGVTLAAGLVGFEERSMCRLRSAEWKTLYSGLQRKVSLRLQSP